MEKIDCTPYVKAHRKTVQNVISKIVVELVRRGDSHDLTKLRNPIEKDTFDRLYAVKQRGDQPEFGSAEYDAVLEMFKDGINHHYAHNRHHPEFHNAGISGMTLVDLVEMFCDWAAVNIKNGSDIDVNIAKDRFGMSDQLCDIFWNTWKEMIAHE